MLTEHKAQKTAAAPKKKSITKLSKQMFIVHYFLKIDKLTFLFCTAPVFYLHYYTFHVTASRDFNIS